MSIIFCDETKIKVNVETKLFSLFILQARNHNNNYQVRYPNTNTQYSEKEREKNKLDNHVACTNNSCHYTDTVSQYFSRKLDVG